jgi:hypothetical protein
MIGAGACLLGALLLTGCSAAAGGAASPAAAPAAAEGSATTPPTTPGTVPTSSAPAAAHGCSNGSTTVPAGAATATTPDVDGDGKPDLAFYAEESVPFAYGIRTSAGGVYRLPDDLAGPGRHSGWTAAIDAEVAHVTVLDDGRNATLHAWVGCRFVTTLGSDGKPYRFGLNGFSDYGTGVTCETGSGGTHLAGVLAKRRGDGRFDVSFTRIEVSADGTKAVNGATETRWTGLAASDPRVATAMRSSCPGAVEVRTSGR